MEHAEVLVVHFKHFGEQLRIFLLELGGKELGIGNGLGFLLHGLLLAVNLLWVRDYKVQPDVWLHLFDHVGELQRRDARYWV